MSYLKCNQLILFLMNLYRLYNKWTYKQELNCELLLLFQFNVVTIHLDGSRKLKGEPRLISSVQSLQFSSVAQSCLTLHDPMNRSTPGLPVHHQQAGFTQTHIHRVSDAIQPSHPLSSPSLPAPNPSQHQSLFQWDNSLHEVAKVLEFQL